MRRVLAAQSFSGNVLARGLAGRKLQDLLQQQHTGALFALVADKRVAVSGGSGASAGGGSSGGGAALLWLDRAGLASALDISYAGGEQMHLAAGDGKQLAAPVYFLGEDVQQQTLRLAVDVTAAPAAWIEERHLRLQDLRSLMPLLPPGELAIAGHAMALSQWHQAHLFCSRCGAPSTSVDGGARRQCTAAPAHRQYPRTDPVVIMLVESPDGGSALLGRSKKMRPGMLTCLSGFTDQGESIEEAVRREVREESGVDVGAVDIVGSQPWPVGRGGSCELMIGCIAQAGSVDVVADEHEMEEVRWVTKAGTQFREVAEAVRLSDAPESPYYGGQGGGSGPAGSSLNFFVPPPIAIAHHLLRQWAQHEGPWFKPEGQEQQQHGGQQQQRAAAASEPIPVSSL